MERRLAALAVIVVLPLGCGTKPPTQAESPSTEASSAAPAKTEAAPSDSAGQGGPTAAASTEPADTEAPCKYDTSQTVTSRIGSVKVTQGCVDPKAAHRILEQYYSQLHGCFSAVVKGNAKAKGTALIKIQVGQKGTYSVRVVKTEVDSNEFVDCLVRALEPLPYPKPEYKGATIEYQTELK